MAAGDAKTDNFILSTASVMIGLPEELHDLNPTEHSLGLVKNFTLTSEPSYVELTQGVKGSIVHSTLTSNPVRASMEVYEYTAANLAYSLGLNGAAKGAKVGASTVSTVVPASPSQNTLVLTSGAGFQEDDYVMIEVNTSDNFVIRQITSISTNTLTLDKDLPAIAEGAKVSVVNDVDIGSKDDQPFFSAKVAGKLANGEPVVVLLPKIRIINGFNLAFATSDYGNLPFEFQIYDLVSTDPLFAEFENANARIFRK